jgi:FMN phosphatase YigB (HAD superfamily)
LDYCTLEVYPDVIEALVQLRKKGIKTGIITNAFERESKRILSQLKLSDYFDIVEEQTPARRSNLTRESFSILSGD